MENSQKIIGVCNCNRGMKNEILRGVLVLFSISVAPIKCWLWYVSRSEFLTCRYSKEEAHLLLREVKMGLHPCLLFLGKYFPNKSSLLFFRCF